MKKVVNVKFEFETDETKTEEQIRECIEEQIYTDLNSYFQSEYDTAQFRSVEVMWDDIPISKNSERTELIADLIHNNTSNYNIMNKIKKQYPGFDITKTLIEIRYMRTLLRND